MSNFLAIATATAALRALLQATVQSDVSGASVSVARPGDAAGTASLGVNLFLYQVMPSVERGNDDLPTRGGDGGLRQRPVAALDLYYLLSFHGNEQSFEPQRLLGSVVRLLHARPIIASSLIGTVAAGSAELRAADLADAPEAIRLDPLSLSLEELSKLWSVFFQTRYRLSLACVVRTVFIEGRETPASPLPVSVRNIQAMPFQGVMLEQAMSADGDAAAIVFGGTLVLRGSGLGTRIASVSVAGVTLAPIPVSANEIQVALNQTTLRAGVRAVSVRATDGGESNALAIVLRPVIARSGGVDRIGVNGPPARITVGLRPDVAPDQRVQLYLNPLPASSGRAHVIEARPRGAVSDNVEFDIPDVAAGDYLLRVRVDGAESLLRTDEDASSPDFGRYIAPRVSIP